VDFLFRKDFFATNFWTFIVLQGSLMGSNIVFKYGKDSFNVPKSFLTMIIELIFHIA